MVFPWREVWLRIKVVEGGEGELGRSSRSCQAIGSVYSQHIQIGEVHGGRKVTVLLGRVGVGVGGVWRLCDRSHLVAQVAKGMTNSNVVVKRRKHPC